MKKFLMLCLSVLLLGATVGRAADERLAEQQKVKNGILVSQRLRQSTGPVHFPKAPHIADLSSQGVRFIPARINEKGTTIFGGLWSTTSETPEYGLYELNPYGFDYLWEDPMLRKIGYPMQVAWLDGDILCGYYVIEDYGTLTTHIYAEVNVTTGALLKTKYLSNNNGFFLTGAYNEDDKCVYGYGLDNEFLFAFMKAPADKPDNFTVIKEFYDDQDCLSIAYCRADQKLYGVNGYEEFVSIDKNTGEQTVLASMSRLGLGSFYHGLCYAPKEDLFYWNAQFSDERSAMYTIDVKTMTTTKLFNCQNNEQFVYFVSPDHKVTASMPAMPAIASTSFPKGATTGSITLSIPAQLATGASYNGSVDWTALLDAVEYSSGTTTAGSEIAIPFTDIAEGMHVFSFATAIGAEQTEYVSASFFVGVDTPCTPASVVLTDKQVSWKAVTAGINNGYVDLEAMEYEVFINDVSYGTTKDTVLAFKLPAGTPVQQCHAKVYARSGGKSSEPGESNDVALGSALALNVYMEPTREDVAAMTIIDVNRDNRTWSYSMYQEALKSSFSSNGPMDDWAILPAIEFPSADDIYTFSADVQICNSSSPDELLEVFIGTAPDVKSMTTEIMPVFKPVRAEQNYSVNFTVPAAGVYYIGLHTVSEYFQEGILIRNIRVVKSSMTPNGPSPVSEATATAAAGGVLEATVSFRMPSTTYTGETLDDETDVKATVTAANTVEVTGKPGETVSATVQTVQGKNTITIVPSIGSEIGDAVEVEVYTGVDLPSYVNDIVTELSEDMMSMTVSWTAPTEGLTGGYVDPTEMTYSIWRPVATLFGNTWDKVEDLGATNTYTYSLAADAPQNVYTIGIVASNTAGQSTLVAMASSILGKPYELPMSENFSGTDSQGNLIFNCEPWMIYNPTDEYNAQWTIVALSQLFGEGEGNALVALGSVANDMGLLGVPCFSTEGEGTATVTLRIYVGINSATTSILAMCYGMAEPEEIGTITGGGNGIAELSFPLPEKFQNKKWVQLYLQTLHPTDMDFCILDAISVDYTTGVAAIAGVDGSISGAKGCIRISGFNGEAYTIVSPDGRIAAKGTAKGSETIVALRPGIYIATCATRTVKVLVK